VDGDDNVYATGHFAELPDFGGGTRPIPMGGAKNFVVSYTAAGAHRFDVAGENPRSAPTGIAVHGGQVYLAVTVNGNVEMGGVMLSSLTVSNAEPSAYTDDAAVVSYSASNGAFRWIKQIGTRDMDYAGFLRMKGSTPVALVRLSTELSIDGHTVEPPSSLSPFLFALVD
jgi:hypothetical protein